MSGGGSSAPSQPTTVTQNTSNLPEYAQPYFQDIMGRAQAASNAQYQPYQDANGQAIQRIAGLSDTQQGVNQNILGMGQNYGFTGGQNLTSQAGLQALQLGNYKPNQITAQTVNGPSGVADIDSSRFAVDPSQAAQMQAAQSNYKPNLTTYQMGPAGTFGQAQADQYTSPYFQNVVDVTKQQNVRDATKDQLAGNLSAGRMGTLGGSRQLMASMERERNLGDLQAKTQATGSQAAYENAQQQYERDRQAGLGVASQNLQAQLGVQQLGTQTGTQMALANLTNSQQAAVQNQAAQLQMQGMNAQQAMQAALANQQSGLTTQGQGLQAALANQQAALQAQQATEQSRQFGANLGLQGLQTAGQLGSQVVQNAAATQTSDLQRLQAQGAVGAQQQQLSQQLLDQQYADFLRQRDYPMEQLGYYSNILHGVPVGLNSTATTYAQPPSMAAQLGGAGLSALSMYNLAK